MSVELAAPCAAAECWFPLVSAAHGGDSQREAEGWARAAVSRPRGDAGVVDGGLCHGAAGLAHLDNRLHQATGKAGAQTDLIELAQLEIPGQWPYNVGRRTAMANAASRSTTKRTRAERLEARVTAEQKNLIERAATLQGRSVTDFVLTSVQDAARRAIEEHSQLTLSVRDSEAFVDALLNPQPVNDRLRDTVRRYREQAGV